MIDKIRLLLIKSESSDVHFRYEQVCRWHHSFRVFCVFRGFPVLSIVRTGRVP